MQLYTLYLILNDHISGYNPMFTRAVRPTNLAKRHRERAECGFLQPYKYTKMASHVPIITVDSLLKESGLKDADLDTEIDRSHYPNISCCLTDWRVLALKFPDISEDDIVAEYAQEENRRFAFLKALKKNLAFRATYRLLVDSLLDIKRAEDARKLCHCLKG